MFEKAGGTSAIQGEKTGARGVSMGQPLVAFCGWRPCAERLRFAHLPGSVAARPEGKGIRKNIKRICGIVINLRCSAFRGMNWGPCIEGKKFQNPGKDTVQAVELRKAVEEVGVLV